MRLPVHGAAAQPITHAIPSSPLVVLFAMRPTPPSTYGRAPNESMHSCIACHATRGRAPWG
eukprot:5149763-Prymnesium_polylepis.2